MAKRNMTADELRRYRAECRLRQWQMAHYLGVGVRSIAAWEGGERPIPVVVAIALSHRAIRNDLLIMGGIDPPANRRVK